MICIPDSLSLIYKGERVFKNAILFYFFWLFCRPVCRHRLFANMFNKAWPRELFFFSFNHPFLFLMFVSCVISSFLRIFLRSFICRYLLSHRVT